jgi:hypothetical protein
MHTLCQDFVFVGWDVALTSEGPMVLEGNENWSAGDFQSLTGRPMGSTRFAEILDLQLKRKTSFEGADPFRS